MLSMSSTPSSTQLVGQASQAGSDTFESPIKRISPRRKKPPPITPRRFTKFFTPRQLDKQSSVRTSRRALRTISGAALNKRAKHINATLGFDDGDADEGVAATEPVPAKKRKLSLDSANLSLQSSPIKRTEAFPSSSQEVPDDLNAPLTPQEKSSSRVTRIREDEVDGDKSDDDKETEGEEEDGNEDYYSDEHARDRERRPWLYKRPTRKYQRVYDSSELLHTRITGRRTTLVDWESTIWQDEVADFMSDPLDVHQCNSLYTPYMTLPFCVASCNTNSLVALGDEQGGVRLLDSNRDTTNGFSKAYLSWRPHRNALMCLNFSADDKQLATGSGDQTAHITDMETQKVTACLLGHQSSIKSIQWQSSNPWIVATSSRDGAINIWDLRTHNRYYAAIQLHPSQTNEHSHNRCDLPRRTIPRPEAVNQIIGAHKVLKKGGQNGTSWSHLHPGRSKGEASITSISFIPEPSREHLLVSTCEAEATIKLWDIRQTYTHDDKAWRPLCRPALGSIPAPLAHASRRAYGMSSLAFSTDASRFYALCRDHTIYAYATSHLILGDAPELSRKPPPTPRHFGPNPAELPTIGPLFALRHPALRTSSFYIKLSIGRTSPSGPEILAVGSSHGAPVLFPTDERYHTIPARRHPYFSIHSWQRLTSTYDRALLRNKADLLAGLVTYHNGMPLVRGHTKEVTSVAWTESGALCTVSDDFTVRMWRENREEAERLRECGDYGPGRWNCGWADRDMEERIE